MKSTVEQLSPTRVRLNVEVPFEELKPSLDAAYKKGILDDEKALVGSMNIDRSAFDLRRELGLTTSDPVIVGRLREVFQSDWDIAHHYEPPDPLKPRLANHGIVQLFAMIVVILMLVHLVTLIAGEPLTGRR